VHDFAEWLGSTPLSVAIQSRLWLTPTLQTIHILMIGVVFVSMLSVALPDAAERIAEELTALAAARG